MIVGDFAPGALAEALAGGGLVFRTGPFVTRLRSRLPEIAPAVATLYHDFPVVAAAPIDFHVRLGTAHALHDRIRRRVELHLDDLPILPSYRRPLSVALMEWGLNACIYQNAHQYLIVHAATVERNGRALLFPGMSGTGKSTLCAAMVASGRWRLLSDELAIVRPADGDLLPLARPISLKNESIDIIRARHPAQVFGPRLRRTAKGVITHMRPPASAVADMDRPARPGAVVFVEYRPGEKAAIEHFPKARAFFALAESAFNYRTRGHDGYLELARLIEGCDCVTLRYSAFDDAIALLEALA
jgi:HprK-related kinase A